MTKQEFENRVKMIVTDNEFDAINTVYMNSDFDKDEFCTMWRKMNRKRIAAYKEQLKAEKEAAARHERLWKILHKLGNETYSCLAEDALTEQEIDDLHIEGIKTQKEVIIMGDKINRYLSCVTVWNALFDYLHAA